MTNTTMADAIDYNTAIPSQNLRLGNPIFYDDAYATITAIIRDNDRRRVTVQARDDDDNRTRVYDIPFDTMVDVGTVVQYGIDRPGRSHIMPVHLNHGARSRGLAMNSIAQYGGRLMARNAIPDATSLTGGTGVDDFRPAD
jgi:hypothetical protein